MGGLESTSASPASPASPGSPAPPAPSPNNDDGGYVQVDNQYDCDSPAYKASGKQIRRSDKKQITKRNKIHCTLFKMKNVLNKITQKAVRGGGKKRTTRRKKNTSRK